MYVCILLGWCYVLLVSFSWYYFILNHGTHSPEPWGMWKFPEIGHLKDLLKNFSRNKKGIANLVHNFLLHNPLFQFSLIDALQWQQVAVWHANYGNLLVMKVCQRIKSVYRNFTYFYKIWKFFCRCLDRV